MSKQNSNSGSGRSGPYKQREKGGTFKDGAGSGGKKDTGQSSPRSGAQNELGQTPKMGIKKNSESGKGSGNR